MKLNELVPGDQIEIPHVGSATFITRCTHPLYPHLQLVIWRMSDESVSLDALDEKQEVGSILPANYGARNHNLRRALQPGYHSPTCDSGPNHPGPCR